MKIFTMEGLSSVDGVSILAGYAERKTLLLLADADPALSFYTSPSSTTAVHMNPHSTCRIKII